MTDQTNASEPTSDGVETQDEEKRLEVKEPDVKKPSITLMEEQPSITVKVGADNEAITWNLPKGLLTHVSPFFEAALNRPWLESKTESLNLPEDDPDAFRFFLGWLLRWTVCNPGDYPRSISPSTTRYMYLRAWALGDKFGCPRFQDFAYAHLQGAVGPIGTDFFEDVYSMTPAGSMLRQWATYTIVGWIKGCAFKSKYREEHWADSVAAIEDLAADIVRFQILKIKPKRSDFVLVSAWEDFVFLKSEAASKSVFCSITMADA